MQFYLYNIFTNQKYKEVKRVIKQISFLIIALLTLTPICAAGIGSGFNGDVNVEEFPPVVWQCGERKITDDMYQPWRSNDCINIGGQIVCREAFARINNYIFEGEQYQVDVVVFDKNKIQDVVTDLKLEKDCTVNKVEKQITYCDSIPATETNWNNKVTLPKFYTGLGDLTNVEIEMNKKIISDIQLEHNCMSTGANINATVEGTIN